jgi:hypothetical protein
MNMQQLDRIEVKLEKLDEKTDHMMLVQEVQQKDLEHHISRTDLLQDEVAHLRKEMAPIRNAKGFMKVLVWIAGTVTAIGAAALTITAAFKHIRG